VQPPPPEHGPELQNDGQNSPHARQADEIALESPLWNVGASLGGAGGQGA
jgi:hypothetical protein